MLRRALVGVVANGNKLFAHMEELLTNPFTIGLGIGLVLAVLTWVSAAWNQRKLRREIRDLQKHLNMQMNVTAKGQESLQKELESLKKENENLRVTVSTLQTKPGRAEIKTLHLYDRAINLMRQRAPGFAPVWENVVQEAEEEMAKTDRGLGKLLKKVFRPSQIAESAESARAGNSGKGDVDADADAEFLSDQEEARARKAD